MSEHWQFSSIWPRLALPGLDKQDRGDHDDQDGDEDEEQQGQAAANETPAKVLGNLNLNTIFNAIFS